MEIDDDDDDDDGYAEEEEEFIDLEVEACVLSGFEGWVVGFISAVDFVAKTFMFEDAALDGEGLGDAAGAEEFNENSGVEVEAAEGPHLSNDVQFDVPVDDGEIATADPGRIDMPVDEEAAAADPRHIDVPVDEEFAAADPGRIDVPVDEEFAAADPGLEEVAAADPVGPDGSDDTGYHEESSSPL